MNEPAPTLPAAPPTAPSSHIGMRQHFEGIVGRNVSDYLMQSAHRHHIRLSQMADTKANMIITVSSVVLTLALGKFNDPDLRSSVLILAVFTLAALLLAILAVLPKYRSLHLKPGQALPPHFNVMFFGHFAELPRERFFELMGQTLRHDAGVYEALTNDLYGLGLYLARHKYRYLRLSYLFFLAGFVLACGFQLTSGLWH